MNEHKVKRGIGLGIMRLLVGSVGLYVSLGVACDLPFAERNYVKAVAESDLQQRATLMQASITACPTFEAWYGLGRVLQKLTHFDEAYGAFNQSIPLASSDRPRALALARLAQTMAERNNKVAAVSVARAANALLNQSPAQTDDAWVGRLLHELELENTQRLVSSAEIGRSLAALRGFSFVDTPKIDLHVNFEFNSDQLNHQGEKQVAQLAEALKQHAQDNWSFKFVGHTDKRGDEHYNLKLSERRAIRVRDYVLSTLSGWQTRLCAEGKGESALRYLGDSEGDHAVNRRVEISLIDRCH